MLAAKSRIVLVGRLITGNENLGLGYLKTALTAAGYDVHLEYLNRGDDLPRIAQAVCRRDCLMVGLSLSDGGSALLPLALGELLRRRGFTGHITCGGQFATLADEWLLERYQWLDSAVRFAGEVPVVALANRLSDGENTGDLPGVRTRDSAGRPSPVLDSTPMTIFPTRDRLPEIVGEGVAQISATRGCEGRCAYCGPAAIQRRERAEGIAGGATRDELVSCGVGGVRRRDLDHICDEMAELWHRDRVRYFYFVDEHILPYEKQQALEFLDAWQDKLAHRKVGPFGIGAMLRAERLTDALATRFARLGLIRAFVGLELATAEEGKRFSRRIDPEHGLTMLDTFHKLGVETVSNLMLVHPYSTIESIAQSLEYAGRIDWGLFELTRMMPYHGTALANRLDREGRLEGNPLRYGYSFDDPRVTRFVQLFTRLRAHAFSDYSLSYYAHDVLLSKALTRRLFPQKNLGQLAVRLEEISRRINACYVDHYGRALSLALGEVSRLGENELISSAADTARRLAVQLSEIQPELDRLLRQRVKRFSPLSGAAAAVFAFSIMGSASLSGCYESSSGSADTDTEAVDDTEDETDTRADTGTETTTHSFDTDTGTETTTQCSPERAEEQEQAVVDAVKKNDDCFDGEIAFQSSEDGSSPAATARHTQRYQQILICDKEALNARTDAANAAIDQTPIDCIDTPSSLGVEGKTRDDVEKLRSAMQECPVYQGYNKFTIQLDANGRVTSVTVNASSDPEADELADCVMSALEGLEFPCLAGFDVCPEYVIAE